MRPTPVYSLGIVKMLLMKLIDLQRDDYGRGYPPKELVMHPEVYADLVLEAKVGDIEFVDGSKRYARKWRGIPLVIDDTAREPYFVTAQGLRATL